ncbi:NADPH:quinone reductase [Saccharopolyspora hordei]|uniref:NADPH:quinone reductase n=1 Tax=Saccharopolyspora hordei TaxID=1838 RepID=UPI0035E67040
METLAAYVTELGPPERIEVGPLPVPDLGPTDVLVRTEALAVNRVDTLVRSGWYPTPTPFPFIIGRDLVGTVTAAGPGAAGFRPGDRVWCNSLGHDGRQGSFAQDVVVAAGRLYHLPDGVDATEAVAVLHPAGTACLGLFREARLGPADTVVVAGGAGAVGSAVVELAAAAGAHVVATASERDAAWCRSSGARAVVDHHAPDHVDRLRDAVPHGADVYWDTSGHHDLAAIAPLLAPGARVVLTATARPTVDLPARHFYTHDISVHGFVISRATVSELAEAARTINARLADGTLRPRVGARLPLAEAAEAHRRQEAGRTGGRIVVLP